MARWMWLIAGPNGAGKSTQAGPFLDDAREIYPWADWADAMPRLNADERALTLREDCPKAAQDELSLRAAREIDAEVARLIAADQSLAVETVLSSTKYRDDVETARHRGFRIGLIYVSLHPPELSPLRIGERVAKGGHAVDSQRAIQRYHRSHAQLSWFAARADFAIVFDNSDSEPDTPPAVLAVKFPGQPLRHLRRGVNPAVDAALDGMAGEAAH